MIISVAPPTSKEKLKSYTDWIEHHDLEYKILSDEDSDIVGGLLLCGGADVGTKPKRDKFEKELIDQALEKDLPILGICRGMQLVNWHLGGVVEDLENEEEHCPSTAVSGESNTHNLPSLFHEVYNPFGGAYGNDREFIVNSRHHQHCSVLAVGLIERLVSSWYNVIEAAEGRKILLVQWHPERKEIWDHEYASDWPIKWLKENI